MSPHVDIYRNGSRLVSATELQTIIAKPFLDKWRLKLCHCPTHINSKKKLKPREIAVIERLGRGHCGFVYGDGVRDMAGDTGTAVHEIVEAWLKNTETPPVTDLEAVAWANKITKVYEQNNVKPYVLQPEENMIDEQSGLAGSPDLVATWNGRPEILDTKIKGSLDELTAFQGCAYRYLLRRTKNVDVRYMRPIWCQTETVGKLVKYDDVYDLEEWMGDWYALVRIWNRLNPKRNVVIHEC